jgi:hypothetical protein
MSEIQIVMKFELLPNEILIECFEYLNAPDIFHSFDQLNYRFSNLIRTIPLHLHFQHVRKSTVDQFCTKILSNPSIKRQIYSLQLSNRNTCIPIDTFLSIFSLDDFSHLRSLIVIGITDDDIEKLIIILPLIPQLISFHSIDPQSKSSNPVTTSLMLKLQTLSTVSLSWDLLSKQKTSLLTNLTLSYSSLYNLYHIFKYAPMLKYLTIDFFPRRSFTPLKTDINLNDHYAHHLKQLIITNSQCNFEEIEILVKPTPNLKCLIIYASNKIDMVDDDRWQNLIQSSLPHLNIFKFKFDFHHTSQNNHFFGKFQSEFWQQHQWYTEYAFSKDKAVIYTIPYSSNIYTLEPDTTKYANKLMKNSFINVTDLTLYLDALIYGSLYHFSNVISLTLAGQSHFPAIYNHFLNPQHLKSLKTFVNLSNVKHLIFPPNFQLETTLVLLQILKQTIRLSSLTISSKMLQSLFNDNELCKYLNDMIKILDISQDAHTVDELERFCQIFSNIEQLSFHHSQLNDLLFVFNKLSKLSIVKISLLKTVSSKYFTNWFETKKRESTFFIEYESMLNNQIHLWIERKKYFT